MNPLGRPWPARALTVMTAAVLGLAACGGDEEPEPAETTASPQAQATDADPAGEQADAMLQQLDAQRAALDAQIPDLPEPCQPFAELNLAVTDLLRASVAESEPAAFEAAFADLDQALADVSEVAPEGQEVIRTARDRLDGDQQALAEADYDLASLEGREESAFSALDDFDPAWVPDECAQEQGGAGDGAGPTGTETATADEAPTDDG